MKVCSVCQRCYEDSVLSCTAEDHEPLAENRAGSREIIADYRLDFLLESDAGGETYRATNLSLNQSRLVKILSGLEENSDRAFLSEAEAASAIDHPNVARVYESGALASGERYVVTEESSGQKLRDFLNGNESPALVASIRIARQTAEALEAIHAAGLSHRALSPDNIILTSDAGNDLLVKVQNFDLGGLRQRMAISGMADAEFDFHQLKYFSPEQCAGETIDARTDIYSLGLVFYEMLAGAPPFDADDAAALVEKQRHEAPPPIQIYNFDLRALITHTLMDSLRKQPHLRIAAAKTMARQLRHIEQLATHSSTPPPALAVSAPARKPAVPTAADPRTAAGSVALAAGAIAPPAKPPVIPPPAVAEENVPVSLLRQDQIIENRVAEVELTIRPEAAPLNPEEIENAAPPVALVAGGSEQPEEMLPEPEIFDVLPEKAKIADPVPESFAAGEDFFAAEDEYVLTAGLLEEKGETKTPAEAASIFSSYAVPAPGRLPVAGRPIMIGAGLVALLIIAAVGNVLLNGLVPSSPPAEQVSARPAPPEKSSAAEPSTDISRNQPTAAEEPEDTFKEDKKDEIGRTENDGKARAIEFDINDLPAYEPEKSLSEKPGRGRQNQISKETTERVPVKKTVTDSPAKASADEAKVKMKALPATRKMTDRKTTPGAIKPDIFSRPRIVKDDGL